jgi:phosphohistidine phosphatase
MTIYFLRHASAGKSRSNPKQDEKRPLDKDGIEQCREVGRALAAADTQVEAIISSPLKRATQTASLVGNELGFEPGIKIEPALRPDAKYEDFRELLRTYSKYDSIMIVGHNPNESVFCSLLLTEGEDEEVIELKKCGVARVEYNGKNSAELTWCITPRLVRALQASSTDKSRPKTARK